MASTKKKKTARPAAAKAGGRTARKPTDARKRLTPGKEARGLALEDIRLAAGDASIAPLVARVEAAGGAVLGPYREPLTGRAVLLAALPREAVDPTPFQRDLSPTHVKRLAQKIEESGSFLDPIIVVEGRDGRFWTPNGRHRLAAAKVLGLRHVTALVSADADLAYRILALNTEKAHNLADRSLEVIRMAKELATVRPRSKESDFAAEFEAPELLTLGLVYLDNGRFAGGAYRPFLKRVDAFRDENLAASLRKRADHAARLVQIDAEVARIVDALKQRGFTSPYLRTYVVARINPVRLLRSKKGEAGPAMEMGAALTRMMAAARKFDLEGVRPGDLALVAAVSTGDE